MWQSLKDAQSIRSTRNQSTPASYIFNMRRDEFKVHGPERQQSHYLLLRNIRPGRDGTTCHKRKYEPATFFIKADVDAFFLYNGNYGAKKSKNTNSICPNCLKKRWNADSSGLKGSGSRRNRTRHNSTFSQHYDRRTGNSGRQCWGSGSVGFACF